MNQSNGVELGGSSAKVPRGWLQVITGDSSSDYPSHQGTK